MVASIDQVNGHDLEYTKEETTTLDKPVEWNGRILTFLPEGDTLNTTEFLQSIYSSCSTDEPSMLLCKSEQSVEAKVSHERKQDGTSTTNAEIDYRVRSTDKNNQIEGGLSGHVSKNEKGQTDLKVEASVKSTF